MTFGEHAVDEQLPDDDFGYEVPDVVDRSVAPEVEHVDTPWWRQGPSWNRVLLGVAIVVVAYYLVSLVQVVQAGRSHAVPEGGADAIVVLGAAQYDGRPSPQLAARLDHVVTLWEAEAAPWVVVTGGNQPGDRFTEASASLDYLVERGIPEAAILAEATGRSTHESLEAAAAMLLGRDLHDVVLVTDPYHAKRSQLIAGGFGLDAAVSSTPTSVVTGWDSTRRHLEEAAGVALGRLVGFDRLSDLTD